MGKGVGEQVDQNQLKLIRQRKERKENESQGNGTSTCLLVTSKAF
jgi:hypothetical protein